MRKCTYLALIAVLVIVSPRAHAFSISGNDSPAATIAADGTLPGLIAGGTMLDVYNIFFHSDDSNVDVTAFNLSFSGSFAQVQLGDGFGGNNPSPLLPSPGGAAGEAQDTHFSPSLTLPGGAIPPPTEGLITFGNTGTGFANDLTSNDVAIAAIDQASSVLIAQIVMLAGDAGFFSGSVAVSNLTQAIIIPETPIGIPEPSTMILAGLGLIGVYTSRRRKS